MKRDRITDHNVNLGVYPPFCFSFLSVFSFRLIPYASLLPARISSPPAGAGDKSLEDHTGPFLMLANATCYPDGTLCSFYNAKPETPRAERCRPKMVLEGISPPTWSGLWRETDHPSLSALRMISPDPLQTQSPAHHLPAVRSTSPSPPMTESHFPPRSASQRKAERLSGRSPRKLSPTRQIRCESWRQCPPRGSQPWMV